MHYDDLNIDTMKRYRPRVVLFATPMTLGEYARRNDKPLEEGDNPEEPGFLVLQGRDEESMYASWSKAEAFVTRFEEI